ncbi:MAG: RDD family protein [Flavobacteriaceae bacterium]|jgi:uncharacterized RDD family membrane protein YckC|nr:RDD family protein [Flavobacteriaceae bacterium]
MKKYLRIVERHKASKGVRLLNYFIDLFTAYFLTVIFWIIGSIAYSTILEIPYDLVISRLENMNSLLDRSITVLSYIFTMFVVETLTKGRSLGKLITGTKVVMIDGTKPTTKDFFVRNIIRGIILVDQLSFLGEDGFHDSWSQTRVVSKSDFERAQNAEKDINSIGQKSEVILD